MRRRVGPARGSLQAVPFSWTSVAIMKADPGTSPGGQAGHSVLPMQGFQVLIRLDSQAATRGPACQIKDRRLQASQLRLQAANKYINIILKRVGTLYTGSIECSHGHRS